MHIALYQPDIPQNVGGFVRLCACFGVPLHIIEPCGFILDDKRLRRVAMDYGAHVEMHRHSSWEAFLKKIEIRVESRESSRSSHDSNHSTLITHSTPRLILLSSKATVLHPEFTFKPFDILLFGRESAGVPDVVRDACDEAIRIPISTHTRSLNVVTAATVALSEALRQTGSFPIQI